MIEHTIFTNVEAATFMVLMVLGAAVAALAPSALAFR